MASHTLLESEASFEAQARRAGLTEAWLAAFRTNGVNRFSRLAYAITTPGVSPTDAQVTAFLGTLRPLVAPALVDLTAVKRLTFESQTLVIAGLRSSVQSPDDNATKRIAPAERTSRLEAQRLRLQGLDLTGPLECSHWLYDQFSTMLEAGELKYISPNKCLTRQQELTNAKPEKQIKLDETQKGLVLKDSQPEIDVNVSTDLALFQAMNRRALAMDLVGLATYSTIMRWHNRLFTMMSQSTAPGFVKPNQAQLLRADRQAFLRLSEMVTGDLHENEHGVRPLDDAFDRLHTDVTVTYHMLPVLQSQSSKPDGDKKQNDKKPQQQNVRTAPYNESDNPRNSRGKGGKGGGKSKGGRNRLPMPKGLIGMHSTTQDGRPICFNYNLGKCSKADCPRAHVCCVPNCYKQHPQIEHK